MMQPTGERISTGVSDLDEVLSGGLLPGRSYLVRGAPGTGKTLLGFHFLTAGAAAGETTLYINLEEPERDVRYNAAALGFDLAEVEFLDLSPTSEPGTGLGLDIVADVADAHDWSLALTEGEIGGARFEFTDVELA